MDIRYTITFLLIIFLVILNLYNTIKLSILSAKKREYDYFSDELCIQIAKLQVIEALIGQTKKEATSYDFKKKKKSISPKKLLKAKQNIIKKINQIRKAR